MFNIIIVLTTSILTTVGIILEIFETLGGGIIFLIILFYFQYLSFRYKRFKIELNLLSLISIAIMGINYLAYVEALNIYPYLYVMLGFLVSYLIIASCFSKINTRAIKVQSNENRLVSKEEEKKFEIINRIYGRYISFHGYL
ncbi:MAG: hypothetical protein JRJ39_03810 [Deltaproteobacteria bacterium]|nr:hypothetical protein [Deltaproteobacteria bacterium]MBW1847647.1 hypothetical protein [Deltaproteobacteria bacterium]